MPTKIGAKVLLGEIFAINDNQHWIYACWKRSHDITWYILGLFCKLDTVTYQVFCELHILSILGFFTKIVLIIIN